MKRVSVRVVLVVILSVWGAYVSAHLLERHYFRAGKTWFSAVCDATGGGCDTVLDSRWAFFPPRPEEEDRGAAGPAEPAEEAVEPTSQPATAPASASASQPASAPASQATTQPTTQPASAERRPELHIPVAFLGLAYFSALGLWFVCVGRPNYTARHWQLLPVVVSALGLLGSIAFIVIMYTQVKAWCTWCLVSHATNVLIFPLIAWLYPRRPPEQQVAVEVEVVSEAGPSLINTVAPAPHPSARLGLVTLFTIAMAVLCEAFWVNSMALTRESREYQRVLADFLKDGESLYAAYQRAPRYDIKFKSADHMRGGSKYPLDVVMFGDFQCYHCRRMARLIEDVNRKFFKGALRVVFKHFPLNQECNPYVSATVHAQACQAARAAEAAYLQNPDAFWKAHDVLFAAQSQLSRADYRTLAAKLGLDPERFVHDMESQTVTDRIQQDVELGNSLGIKGTPRVYVSGREVPDAAMWQLAFWQTVAEHYDAAARQLQAKQAAPPAHGH